MSIPMKTVCTVLLAFLAFSTGCVTAQEVTVTRTADGYLFRDGDEPVMVYHAEAPDPAREHGRAHYVHPIYALDGTVLTEDFPEDHLHQHGLFWAWHQLLVGDRRVGDGWEQIDVAWEVAEVDIVDDSTLRSRVLWHARPSSNEPFIGETATLSVHSARDGYRAIDVTIELRALVDGVRLGGSEDEKGYGGLSLRLRLPEDVRFTGRGGRVEPMIDAVEAGPWVDVSATYGTESGVAILQHPSNPGYPNPWILRDAESMQNAAWPGREPVEVPTGDPLVLRYRLIVHDGSASAVPLDALHAAYAAP